MVDVVNAIPWCDGPPEQGHWSGCSRNTGFGMVLIKETPANLNGTLWAHEYGHNEGRHDRSGDVGYVMRAELFVDNRKLTTTDCDYMRHPLN